MQTIVYTIGVWDLLHVGHVDALRMASKLGDILIVGVQEDWDVVRQKGKPPTVQFSDRVKALEALGFVDIVVGYESNDYLSNIKKLKVDVLALNDEYMEAPRFKPIVDWMESHGKKVIYTPYHKGISASDLKRDWRSIWSDVGVSAKDDLVVGGPTMTQEKYHDMAQELVDFANLANGDTVVDYGCGSGILLDEIRKIVDIVPVGIDISHGMIKRAMTRMPGGVFVAGEAIVYLKNTKLYVASGSLHYLDSVDIAMTSVQCMKTFAKHVALLSLPNVETYIQREMARSAAGKNQWPRHLYFRKELLEWNGLKVTPGKWHDFPEYSFNAWWSRE